jgi:hypothetical protein
MAFTARDALTIRATILANRAARYRNRGKELSVVEGSDAYIEADAYALELEALEQQALQLTKEYFPDSASDEVILRHAKLIGLFLKPATAARLAVLVTGAPGTTSPCIGKTLNAADGTKYVAVSGSNTPLATITLDGSGEATVLFLAQSTGAATSKAAGTILTWSTAPTGFDATDDVITLETIGLEIESIDALRDRVLRWWRERPGAGNRADLVDWAESRSSIFRAYVYPLAHASLGLDVLGSTRVLLLGQPSARTVAALAGLSAGNVQEVADYFFGTGGYAAEGGKLTTNIDKNDYDITEPDYQLVTIAMQITLGPGYAFPFAGTFTTAGGSTTTRIQLTADPTATIDVLDKVAVPSATVRGGYEVRTVVARAASYIDLDSPIATAPAAAKTVRPAPQNWEAMLAAVLAVTDRLGPGDVDTLTHPECARWPTYTTVGPATLYRAALIATCMGVPGLPSAPVGIPGVVSAAVTLPVADVTPAAFSLVVPDEIYFTA